MALSIDAFPEEIFIEVLTSLKLTSGPSALIPCLLCCKKWHQSTIPLLYRDIILKNSNLEHLFSQFPESQGGLVRTLTVALTYPIENPDGRWQRDAYLGTRKTRRMKRCLRALSGFLRCMSNLTTFSFAIRHDMVDGTTNLQFPRDTLTDMLLALPQTCVNIEIVVCGPEERNNRSPDDFCKTLIQILPRLKHLRLQVGRLCPDFLGEAGLGKDDTDGSICISLNPALCPI
ncbi:hypothetical protein Asppvi_001902 [Aspergillus pseudoviridinutans]|uniref:F-box domain-containing protein n=1 Tax=Aspergillus pseudoviridinutans TaxID=1517512 RepID=A0A9P3BRE2_9EURO|nr:uncharacterized protein Asppvi_001902 [Aspergillus pseudoviridinutans]GIJ92624.1 hypothetical protein Asppvi_001902 [Aspergillus pseudoviridinutans]